MAQLTQEEQEMLDLEQDYIERLTASSFVKSGFITKAILLSSAQARVDALLAKKNHNS